MDAAVRAAVELQNPWWHGKIYPTGIPKGSQYPDAGIQIFSSDKDFILYAKHLPITMYQPVTDEAFSMA
jgi:hypothetical protein